LAVVCSHPAMFKAQEPDPDLVNRPIQ
jgi:hypothetical protein